jgi:phosphatidylcholine synthase
MTETMAAMNETKVDASEPGTAARARAFAVHVFTASGAGLALLALLAATAGRWSEMFLWLGVALFVDGIDGTLARRFEVARVLPRWSGDTLDFVVDILTYVFVPAYAIVTGELLPQSVELIGGFLILVTGTLYFADRQMKTADNYFRGFPAIWNVVAFYLFLLRPDPWLTAAGVAALAVLTFMPVPFVHPVRVPRYRLLNMLALTTWIILALYAIRRDLSPGPWVTATLSAIGIYFLCAGLLRRHHENAKTI